MLTCCSGEYATLLSGIYRRNKRDKMVFCCKVDSFYVIITFKTIYISLGESKKL